MLPDAAEVFVGAYNVPNLSFEKPEKVLILDIGANCGAFAVWAADRWPKATIHCYEPQPEALGYLTRNARDLPVTIHGLAVTDATSFGVPLRLGKHNLGEASFHNLGCQTNDTIPVDTISAQTLPPCEILKIDTEGSEVTILSAYFGLSMTEAAEFVSEARTAPTVDRIFVEKIRQARARAPAVISFEFHRETDRVFLDRFLLALGYVLMCGTIRSPMLGVLNYVHSMAITRPAEAP
jgi:FkbM family methyltransferase